MNQRRGSALAAKRKTSLHITGDKISPHRPRSPYFGRERNQQVRPRASSLSGLSPFHVTNKGIKDSTQPGRDAPVPPKRILDSTCTLPKNGSGNNKPATFVCEGIEVNFDSSDSEEEVRPWRVVKVLKNSKADAKDDAKADAKAENEENSRRQVVNKVLHKHGQPIQGKSRNGGEGQISGSCSKPVIISRVSERPSYVILPGLKKRPSNPSGAMSNCAIIKRPRFLFSQQVRPSMGHFVHAQFSFPRLGLQENSPPSTQKNADLTPPELRIIDDVLDMMEEVETRARY